MYCNDSNCEDKAFANCHTFGARESTPWWDIVAGDDYQLWEGRVGNRFVIFQILVLKSHWMLGSITTLFVFGGRVCGSAELSWIGWILRDYSAIGGRGFNCDLYKRFDLVYWEFEYYIRKTAIAACNLTIIVFVCFSTLRTINSSRKHICFFVENRNLISLIKYSISITVHYL